MLTISSTLFRRRLIENEGIETTGSYYENPVSRRPLILDPRIVNVRFRSTRKMTNPQYAKHVGRVVFDGKTYCQRQPSVRMFVLFNRKYLAI